MTKAGFPIPTLSMDGAYTPPYQNGNFGIGRLVSVKPTLKPCLAAIAGLSAILQFAGFWAGPIAPPFRAKAFTVSDLQTFQKMENEQKTLAKATEQAKQVYRRNGCGDWLAERTARYSIESGLPSRLVAATVVVESSCRPAAVSSEGAVGLMQIAPKTWHQSRARLKDPDYNLRIGCRILAGYVHQSGVREGLHRYNGLGNATDEYANLVLTKEWR